MNCHTIGTRRAFVGRESDRGPRVPLSFGADEATWPRADGQADHILVHQLQRSQQRRRHPGPVPSRRRPNKVKLEIHFSISWSWTKMRVKLKYPD